MGQGYATTVIVPLGAERFRGATSAFADRAALPINFPAVDATASAVVAMTPNRSKEGALAPGAPGQSRRDPAVGREDVLQSRGSPAIPRL
jgi:hypothetical protein